MTTTTRTLIFAGVVAALSPGISLAEGPNHGYVIDTARGVVISGTGLCWHSGTWKPTDTNEQCDPNFIPMKVAEAPAPKLAVITPAPVKIVPQKISFSADALFDFDKSVLKPEGKAMLDELARGLNGAEYNDILATGHTDRFGSAQYNQALSQRRANAVRDYLASKDIPADRINAEGRGETQPMTALGDCKGAKSNKVIACLQPDRRVDVEMTGTKERTASSQ
jgi:OmpA-OmpF porin, OOP family